MSKFSDRFIKVPVHKTNADLLALTDKVGEMHLTFMMINPFDLGHYEPDIDGSGNIVDRTWIRFKGVSEMIGIALHVKEFEALLNKHSQPL